MESGKIVLGILLFIAGLVVIANWYQGQQPKTSFKATLVTESLFEAFPFWTKTEFKRLIYQYPRNQVPQDATYFTVNITIPDNIANQLDQLASQYSNLKDAFYPRVYAARVSGSNFQYFRPFSVLYIERAPNGIPKKLQVKFKTSDVPQDAQYLIVTFHIPFFEDWDDNSLFCFQIGYTDSEGQWTAVKMDKSICIAPRYDRNTWTSWRILNDQSGNEGWSVLKRELNMPINPYKPLYMKWLVDYYETGSEPWGGGGQFVVGLKFELNDSSEYFVAFRAWYNSPHADLNDYKTAFQDMPQEVPSIDCAFTVDKNNELLDIAAYIQQYCDLDWNKVRKLKAVYIALRDEYYRWYPSGEGHTILSYIFIAHQDFVP